MKCWDLKLVIDLARVFLVRRLNEREASKQAGPAALLHQRTYGIAHEGDNQLRVADLREPGAGVSCGWERQSQT